MANINNLFARISELNLTAKAVSDATGISTGNLSDWKSGRSMPSADKLQILSDYLQCSIDFLLGNTDNPSRINSEFGNFEFALFGEVKDMTDAEKQDILDYIRYKKQKAE